MIRSLWIVGALVVTLAGARLAWEPGLLGSRFGEVYGHAWHVWWHAIELPRWAGGTDLAVGTAVWPVLDPLPMAVASVVTAVGGLELGYDAWILFTVGLAFAGGAALARAVGGHPLVGALGLALAPSFTGVLSSGVTEDSAIGLVALSYAALLTPRGHLVGGALLGVLVWCGPVLAYYAALGAVVLGVAELVGDRSRLRPFVLAAATAGAIALPAVWLQRPMLGGALGREVERGCSVDWRHNPTGGADLVSLVTPGRLDLHAYEGLVHPGYLGLTILVLALLGWRHRLGWVALLLVGLSLGFRLCLTGRGVLGNPIAHAVALLPFADALHDHARGLGVAGVALAGLASLGATRLGRGAALAPLAVAADLVLFSPVPYPLPVAPSRPSEIAHQLEDLALGPVLVVPATGPGVNFLRPLLDQRVHGRKVLIDPERPGVIGTVRGTPLGRWLHAIGRTGPLPPPPSDLDLPSIVAVVVAMEPHVAAVEAVLGTPDVRAADGAAWDVAR